MTFPAERHAGFGTDLLALAIGVLSAFAVAAPSIIVSSKVALLFGVVALISVADRRQIGRADVLMLGWTLLTLLSLWWTVSVEATAIAVRTQVGVCILFILIRTMADRRRVLGAAILGYLVGCLAAAWSIWNKSGIQLELRFNAERIVLDDLNQNYLAYSLVVAIVLLFLVERRFVDGSMARLSLIAFGVVMILGANQAGTRGALVALLAFAVWALGSRFAPRAALAALLMTLVALSILALSGWADDYLRAQFTASERETGELNGRLLVWPLARDMFQENPLFGIGAGAFRDVNPLLIDTHSAPLELATGLGVVGLFLFCGTLFQALVADTRAVAPRARALYVGGLLVMLGPILLSGHWHQAPAMWVVIAICSRLPVLLADGAGELEARPDHSTAPHDEGVGHASIAPLQRKRRALR